jgi:hypothetical protein
MNIKIRFAILFTSYISYMPILEQKSFTAELIKKRFILTTSTVMIKHQHPKK